MGRKKTYDREDLVGRAVELFRDHGFAGTTTQMLVEALGVNRYSLYAEFGSKQALFDLALQRYDDIVIERSFGPLEASGAGVREVRSLLEFYGNAGEGPAAGRGCLLCNTAVEFGPTYPGGEAFVQRYFERLSGAFASALERDRKRGVVRRSVDARKEAAFLTATVLGLFVMVRANAPTLLVQGAAAVATRHLDSLLAEQADTTP